MKELRPRRSVLYMPGSNERALIKAQSLAADCVVFDLEDGCAPEVKVEARQIAVAAANSANYGRREVIIRVNAIGSAWFQADLQAVASSKADAICLPKVETAQQVLDVAALLGQYGADDKLTLWAMIETPLGVENAVAIAAASDRLSVLMMGTSDLVKEMRLRHSADRIGFHYALGRCVHSARLAGIDVIDGVHLDLSDAEGFAKMCEQGRDFGFDGKSLIHPKQIDDANASFGFSDADIDYAQRVLAAWQQAESDAQAVVVVDGKLVEMLHVEEAKRVLAMADLLQVAS